MSHINLAIIGTISAGKSTLFNALVTDHLSETHIKKTTLLPHIFHESDQPTHTKEYIKLNTTNHTDQFNDRRMDGLPIKLEELHYNIKKIQNFIEFQKPISLNIYDIPGLNDSETKKLYYDYLTNIFKHLNIVLWTVDINSSVNTSDEIDILDFLLLNIKENKSKYQINTKLIILLNKCDDMNINPLTNELILDGDHKDMYDQAKKIIDNKIVKNYPEFKYDMIPISSINAYIYRMIQNGKLHEIDETHMNILGTTEYSKIEWKGFSDKEKKEKIKIKLNPHELNLRINNTGFTDIKSCIQKHIDQVGIASMLLDVIKSDIVQLFDSCSKKSDMYNISSFAEIKYKIEKLNSEYIIPSDLIQNTLSLYNIYINQMVLIYESNNVDLINNIPNIDNLRQFIDVLKFYDDLYNFIDKNHTFNGCKILLKNISDCLINKIDQIEPIQDKINYLYNEFFNNEIQFPLILMSHLSFVAAHCFSSNNVIYLSDSECIHIITESCKKINLPTSDIISIYLKLIDIRYANYFKESKKSHIIRRAKFWNDLMIDSANVYSLHLFHMKKMLDHYIIMNPLNSLDSLDQDNDMLELEVNILEMLKKMYCNDFMTVYELFQKLN